MLDEFLAFTVGMFTATLKIKNPSPRTYGLGFLIGVIVMAGGVFLALALSEGFLSAIHLMREKVLSAAVIATPLIGGVIGACFVWTLSSKRRG